MTEDDIYPLLATLAGGKVYPYVAPLVMTANRPSHHPGLSFPLSDVSADVLCGQAESRVSVRSMCIPQPSLNHDL
jgi:hypothetical protein